MITVAAKGSPHAKAALNPSQLRKYQLAFGVTGATALGGASWLFRDLADLSQW